MNKNKENKAIGCFGWLKLPITKKGLLGNKVAKYTKKDKDDESSFTLWDYLEYIGRSPLYTPLVTIAVAWVGVAASLYPEEIRSSFGNIALFSGDPINWTGTNFWGLVILAGFLFWGKKKAEKRAIERENDERKRLIGDLRSMPPDSFLEVYGHSFRETDRTFKRSVRQVRNEDLSYNKRHQILVACIRAFLSILISLAKAFDEEKDDRYAANVMIYIPSREMRNLSEEVISNAENRLMHAEPEVSIEKLRGILDLRKDLSVKEDGDEAELKPVAFAIPQPHRSERDYYGTEKEKKWRIGPGAPKALLTGDAQLFGNTREIADWLDNWSTLGSEAKLEVLNYITSEKEPLIGSFFSSALIATSEDEGEGSPNRESEEGAGGRGHAPDSDGNTLLSHPLPYGVLNVHRQGTGILKGMGKSQQYFEFMILAIKSRLATLIELLSELEYQEHGTWEHLS